MRKDDTGKSEWVKHSRNSNTGKRGHNKRVRKAGKTIVRKSTQG